MQGSLDSDGQTTQFVLLNYSQKHIIPTVVSKRAYNSTGSRFRGIELRLNFKAFLPYSNSVYLLQKFVRIGVTNVNSKYA